MPNPYSFGDFQRPSQPIEHLASRPALKKQMSRVWSRCLSINRKTQHQPKNTKDPDGDGDRDGDFEGMLRSVSERRVFVERGYEVVPRITSTHLAKSRGGFSEVDAMEKKYSSLSSVHMKTQLPYYSHPLSESTQRRTNLPRRPSVIQPKLSRGQIAKFRNASGGSQISSNSIPISNNRPSQGNTQEASSTGPSYSNHKNLYPPSPADNSFSSSTSTITMKSLNESGSSTPRGNRNKKLPLSPLDTKPRRHLASSRSTAEMKGRSPTTPSSRPSSSKNTPKKSELVSFETSTPRPGYEVRYPFVCPDRLVQRPHPHQREKEVLSPTFMRPRPAPRPPGYVEDRSSPELADIMSYQTTSPTPPSPTPPPVPAPVDSETLERLFNEVLQACRTGDIPFSPTNSGESVYSGQTSYMSPEQVSRQSRYSAETFRSPGESSGESFYSPEAITPHVRRTGAPWSPSFEFDVDADADSDEAHVARSPSFPTAPNARPSTQGRKPEVEVPKRFIPSGRSFEPLRAINVQNTGTMTDSRRDEQWKGSVKRGKVREAVAKFENVAANSATPPTTPIRVIGEILDRPTLADSHGLSEESRRLTRMKRLPR